ncbi:hypothetical protein Cni_G01615 [Canna indica]|uniref:Uncharacterized protein n=1 Tax=Canna indica TaxID=4628 RepID=A0AAQ3JPH6_9LILI|nr:hypothetical protein Cni_G01615 [Canna indica]
MDKLLAMSILSSTPADLSGSCSWLDVFALKKTKDYCTSGSAGEAGKSRNYAAEEQRKQQQKQHARTRFGPEFDGLDVFGTLISY